VEMSILFDFLLLSIGVFIGMLFMSMFIAAKRSDEINEQFLKEKK